MRNNSKKLSIILALVIIQLIAFTNFIPNTPKAYASSNSITIKNFRNNETITYELPIIKGILSTYASKVKVSVNNGTETEWTVHPSKYTFKAIAQLNEGINIVKLSAAGNDDTYLTITYSPRMTGPAVRFTYLIPSDTDGSFRAPYGIDNSLDSAKKRYTLQALLMQSAWAECMNDRGYGRNTFRIENPTDDTSNVVFVKTADKTEAQFREYTNENLSGRTYQDFYIYIKSQISPHPYDIKNFVIPSSSSHTDRYLPNGEIISQAATALGGYDLAIGESSHFYKIPEDISGIDSTLYNTDIGINTDICPYWEQFGLSIGGGMHELGHCFGLNHLDSSLMIDWDNPETIKRTSDRSSIMAYGFRHANRLFAVKDGNGIDFEDDVNQVNWNWGWTETESPVDSFIQNDCQILSDSAWICYNSLYDEAEWNKNTLSGNAQIFHNTISSGNVVGNIGVGYDNALTFNDIYTDKSGTYMIRVYYISEENRSCTISTNGNPGIYYTFEGKNSNTPVYKEIPVDLQAGYNTIKLYNQNGWAPDIDKISLPFTLSNSLPLIFEAESPYNTFGGNVSIWINSRFSACKAVGGIDNDNFLIFNNVFVDRDGDYTLRVSYITGDDRTCNISTNHDKGISYSFTGSDWNTVSTKDITLNLREGNNRIKFYNENSYAPDIDKIEIIGIPYSDTSYNDMLPSIGDLPSYNDTSSIEELPSYNDTPSSNEELPSSDVDFSYNDNYIPPYYDNLTSPMYSVNAEYYNTNNQSPINQISSNLKITNSGSEPINLSDLKIRYYYTINGVNSQNFFCDYASINNSNTINSSNVTGTFVELSRRSSYADYYLEIGFTNNSEILYPGSHINMCTRMSKSDWSNTYIQEDDYSFNSSSELDMSNMPIYISGVKVFGKEP